MTRTRTSSWRALSALSLLATFACQANLPDGDPDTTTVAGALLEPLTVTWKDLPEGAFVTGAIPIVVEVSPPPPPGWPGYQVDLSWEIRYPAQLGGLQAGRLGTFFAPPFAATYTPISLHNTSLTFIATVTDYTTTPQRSVRVERNVMQILPQPIFLSSELDNTVVGDFVDVRANINVVEAVYGFGPKHVEIFDGSTRIAELPHFSYQRTFRWDTTAAALGPHTLVARATDWAGNVTESAPLHLTVARGTPPTVAIISPTTGSANGLVQVVAAASSSDGIERVDFFDNDVLFATATAAPYVVTWDTTALGNGARRMLKARAVDRLGRTSTATPPLDAWVTKEAPTLSVSLTPAPPAILAGTAQILATAAATAGPVTVTASIDGVDLATLTAPPYQFNWDTSTRANGPHVVRVVAKTGLLTAESLTYVEVFNRPISVPAVAITDPLQGAVVKGSIPVKVEASDVEGIDRVELFVDGVALATLRSAPYETTLDTDTLPEGTHTLAARATDLAGTFADAAVIQFKVERAPTSFDVALDNLTAGMVVGQNVTVRARTANDALVTGVSFFEGSTLIGTATAAPFQIIWNPGSSGDKSLTAQATAFGRTYTSPAVLVSADIDAPAVALTAPAPGAVVSGIVPLIATATDNRGVSKVEFFDGSKLIGTELDAPYTESWNTAGLPLGTHTLIARATDAVGNTRDSDPVTVTVLAKPDTTPPKAAITTPVGGTVVGNSVVWTTLATDNVGVTRIELYDGATLVKSFASSAVAFVWNTAGLAAGVHKLSARAFDGSGNRGTSAITTITVDHTAPSVALVAPTSGAKVSGNVTLVASASDNIAVARVVFTVAGVVRCTDTSAPYTCGWTVPAGTGKTYALQAQAIDTAGNTRSSSAVTVTAR